MNLSLYANTDGHLNIRDLQEFVRVAILSGAEWVRIEGETEITTISLVAELLMPSEAAE
jgi:hypothetical protein